jgi:hypothetical protein
MSIDVTNKRKMFCAYAAILIEVDRDAFEPSYYGIRRILDLGYSRSDSNLTTVVEELRGKDVMEP